jgi:hypothetical protein
MKLLVSALFLTACGAQIDDVMPVPPSSVTLDNTGFYDDGARWWTDHSALMLTGTYDGSPDARIDVEVSGTAVPAVLDGSRWTAQLPDGAITPDAALVSILMTEPGGAHATRQQMFALDLDAPVITALPSPFRDERGDVITFDGDGPVHDHQGEEIDLAASGCAPVYKYAYLAAASPAYGHEVTPNPLRWNLDIDDIKVASVDYRVSSNDGAIVRDWMPVTGSDSAYPIELQRDGTFLDEYNVFHIDVRARDWAGHESTTAFCIEYEPLAAPLDIATPVAATGPDSLASWTLAANSPISRLINAGNGPVVFEQRLTQYTTEPVFLTLGDFTIGASWTLDAVEGYVPSSYRYPGVAATCQGTTYCTSTPGVDRKSSSGNITTYDAVLEVVDGASNRWAAVDGKVRIPGRTPGAPPSEYRVRVRLSSLTQLASLAQGRAYDEHAIENLEYTGFAPVGTATACVETTHNALGALVCAKEATYQYIQAIDALGMQFASTRIDLRVGISQTGQSITPFYAANDAFTTPMLTWNAGPKDLGGY